MSIKNATSGMDTKPPFFGRYTLPAVVLLVLSGCAVAPPVQEMSDARQAISAAIEADAQRLAPDPLLEAERLVGTARTSLEQGDYEAARQAAVAARIQAMQARDWASSSSKVR